jgi:hypothetical protein
MSSTVIWPGWTSRSRSSWTSDCAGHSWRSSDSPGPERSRWLDWEDLARVLGQPIPYWPSTLRDAALLTRWKPGAASVTAPAVPDLDNAALLRLAAIYDADEPACRVLVNLARFAQHRAR